MPPNRDSATARRLAQLEAFVSEVSDIAETLQILGETWSGDVGAAVSLYGKQLGERSQQVMIKKPTD